MFHNVAKVVLRDRGSTLASFSEDDFHFSWQGQHFGAALLTCGVACFLRIAMPGLRDSGQIVRQVLVS